MNLGIFGGRLGKHAEPNQLSNGDSVANFSLAVDIGTKANPKTMWVECALFGKRAETLLPYLQKGTKVTVSGRVSLDEFVGRDGQKRTTLRLTISEIDLHLPPREHDATASQPQQSAPRAAAAPAELASEDDIPF